MASSINTVAISGNLTRDAKARETSGGNPIVSFSVAVNDRRKNPSTGEWEDYPNFIDCTMFGNYARAVAPAMKKGVKVAVMGKLRWSQWERDGQKHSKVEVIAESLEIMTRGQREQAAEQPHAAVPHPASSGQTYRAMLDGEMPQQAGATIYDDEIPF